MTTASCVTLVSGGSYAQRESAIAAAILSEPAAATNAVTSAVILEGLPDGNHALQPSPTLQIQRIAPGCLCCIGNLVMRVTLNRILQRPPKRLYLGLADAAHREKLLEFLQQAPYLELLTLDQEIRL